MSAPRRRILLALGAAAVLLPAGCITVRGIDLGKAWDTAKGAAAVIKGYTWDDEKEIGGAVAAQLASRGVVPDGPATSYVNLVAATVANYSDRPGVLPRVMILTGEEPNAFACPGGYLFVTRGLLRLCRDESELAGVLSHEFTHVARKHTINRLEQQRTVAFVGTTAADYSPEKYKQALDLFGETVGKAADEVVGNKHDQKAEKEADEVGAECAARAGYDGAGLARVVERMKEGPKDKTGWKEFSVYPDGTTRAQNIQKHLAGVKLPAGGATNAERYKRELAGALR